MQTILATLASAFYGASYIAPKPWCFLFIALAATCVVWMRLM